MSQRQHSIIVEPLVRATVDKLPSGPALLALARFRYAPKARFGPAAGPGPVAFVVESGSLIFSAQGAVSLRRNTGDRRTEWPPPNQEFTVQPGDELLIPGNVVHAVRNAGNIPAMILGAATFPGGGPPKNFPDGVTFMPLVMNSVSTLAPAPAEYALNRVTLAPGSREPDAYYMGPGLHYVEDGTLNIQVINGEVQIIHDLMRGQIETVRAGAQASIQKAQGAVVPAGAVITIGNEGPRPVVVMSLRTGAAFVDRSGVGASGNRLGPVIGDRPSLGLEQILPSFIRDVMDSSNPAAVAKYLAPGFFSHDLPPASTFEAEKTTAEGVAFFLGKQIFPSFSRFQTKFAKLLSEGDLVASHWIQTFQHTGDGYFGAKASGASVTIHGFTIGRVKDGQLVEHWEQRDIPTWHRTIGIGFPLGPLEGGRGLRTPEQDKAVVAEYWKAWNSGERIAMERLLAPTFTNNLLIAGQLPGFDGIMQLMDVMRNALGGFQVTLDLLVTDGTGQVFSRVRFSGTHQNTFFGVPATGRAVEFGAIDLFTVQNGVIVDRSGLIDESLLAIQLGVLKPPGGP
jgi:predicted ester cyclase/mannose-6-phosphate isomerase-like protein (cupin superfamily)